jgi:hypothetical protein
MDCAQSALMHSEEDARIIADAAEEIERLRARVEVLERIRAAADNLFTYDSGWSHWEKKYRELRAVLK